MATEPMSNMSWTVEAQSETTQYIQGQLVRGWNIGFVTSTGVHGSVFVSEVNYNAETVKRVIAQKVAAIMAVSGLSG